MQVISLATQQHPEDGTSTGTSSGASPQQQNDEFVDTRIHWDDPNEGWIEGDSGWQSRLQSEQRDEGMWQTSRDLVMAIMQVDGTHYTTLGLTPTANVDSVKAAYRRLSKLYHPDTTELPVAVAEQKFVQLREAYSVLSSSEQRRLYDWKIAQEFSSRQRGARFVWPYEVDRSQRGAGSRNPAPLRPRAPGSPKQALDESGNVPLSDNSIAALTFDVFALTVSVLAIIYAAYFKQ